MASFTGVAPKPKKQVKPIVKIQPTDATNISKGVGKPIGAPSFTETDIKGRPLRNLDITKSGIVQPEPRLARQESVAQLTNEQKKQLGFEVPLIPQEVQANIETLRNSNLSPVTSDLTQVQGGGGTLPLPQPENALNENVPIENLPKNANVGQAQTSGLSNLVQSTANAANLGNVVTDELGNVIDTRTPAEKLQTDIGLALALSSVGLSGLSSVSGKTKAISDLNSISEARYYAKTYADKAKGNILRGGVPKAGEAGVNPKTSELVKGVVFSTWGKISSSLAGIAILLDIIEDPSSKKNLQPTFDKITSALAETDKAASVEQIPIVKEAYIKESERLSALLDDISNPSGWDDLALRLPFVKHWKTDKIIVSARENLREHRLKMIDILQTRGAVNQRVLDYVNTLTPEEQRAWIEYSQFQKQLKGVSVLASELPSITQEIEGGEL
jgi:hypothetical protein